jgi:hypothetical protein
MDSEKNLSRKTPTDAGRMTWTKTVRQHACFPVCVDLDFDSSGAEESEMESAKHFSLKTSTGEWIRISINPRFKNAVSLIHSNIDLHSKVTDESERWPAKQLSSKNATDPRTWELFLGTTDLSCFTDMLRSGTFARHFTRLQNDDWMVVTFRTNTEMNGSLSDSLSRQETPGW